MRVSGTPDRSTGGWHGNTRQVLYFYKRKLMRKERVKPSWRGLRDDDSVNGESEVCKYRVLKYSST